MTCRLPQIVTNAKNEGWYDWICEPDGQLHPNTERALLDGCYFDAKRAQRLQDFFVEFLTLPREAGESITQYEIESIQRRFPDFDPDKPASKKPFAMLKWWHQRTIGQCYGWRRPDGGKRFRKGFITTAKKSGKTTTLAGLPLAELLMGDTPEKEIYVVATTEDQAGYLFKKTHAMLQRSPKLKKLVTSRYSTNVLYHAPTNSIYKTLPAVAEAIQGIQPNLLILDELHAWRGREVYDGLIYGDIRRSDSLRLIITTAGDDVNSVAYEEYEAAKELLDPNNDRYEQDAFAFIAEAGRDRTTGKEVPWEWDDEKAFIDANPTLWENPQPIIKLRQEMETARNTPGKKRGWIRYMCNRYVSAIAESWIDLEKWDACGMLRHEFPSHIGDDAWCGLDLARVEDLVALATCWWADDEEDTIDLDVQFWMPTEGLKEKAERWRTPQLFDWIDKGWIKTTPGWAIETNFLRREISGFYLNDEGERVDKPDPESIASRFSIKEFAYDRNMAANLVIQQLGEYDHLPVIDHPQNYPGMSNPSKEFARRVLTGKLRHNNNPVMRWMFNHCVAPSDANDNIKPDRKKSRHKIDGVVASVMAVGRATLNAPKHSVYESRGVMVI